MTFNCRDFRVLADAEPDHPGLLLVYQNKAHSDMRTAGIVSAVGNIWQTYANGVRGMILTLNDFQWQNTSPEQSRISPARG